MKKSKCSKGDSKMASKDKKSDMAMMKKMAEKDKMQDMKMMKKKKK